MECQTFIDNDGKPEADTNCNDDCIMAYSIALQVRQVAGKWFEWFEKKKKKREEDSQYDNEEVGWL